MDRARASQKRPVDRLSDSGNSGFGRWSNRRCDSKANFAANSVASSILLQIVLSRISALIHFVSGVNLEAKV